MLFSLPMPMSVSSESLVGRMLCGPKAWLIFSGNYLDPFNRGQESNRRNIKSEAVRCVGL